MMGKFQLHYLKLSLSLVFLHSLSCSSPKSKGITTYEVPKAGESNYDLSELSKSIDYISLETNEESFLSLIQDIEIYKDRVFVVDFPGRILVFDINGKFLQRIGKEGEGPGEFYNLNSFVINKETETVHVASGRRLISYTLDNKFIGEKSFPFFIDFMEIVNNKLSLVAGEDGVKSGDRYVNKRSLFMLDSDLIVVDSIPLLHIEMEKQMGATYPYKNYVSKVGKEDFIFSPVLFNEDVIRDTLYKVQNGHLVPFLKLNFEGPLFNEDGKKLILLKNILLSKNFLICEYDREGGSMFYIRNRGDDFSLNLKDGVLIDDDEIVVLRPLNLSQDQFYFIKTTNFSDILEEELNPVIGIVKL
ncbi:6-bladed beta-propeller [Algoriphagus resistens]|uniref:6-bladed beta-propeller n=1 Tax=Algoriphagus resistens TaxID=1750590 RepID=UPI0007168CCB|nr:6-bladed beta-propeller [Algoriphagus resistens]